MADERRAGIRTAILREIANAASSRTLWMLAAVLPLASFALLYATFRSGVPRDLPLAVLDADRSALSRAVVRAVDASPTIRTGPFVGNPRQGLDTLLRGQAYGLLVLPEGLERDVKRAAAPEVVLYYNAQWLLPGSLISRDLRKVVATISAGINIRSNRLKGKPFPQALALAEPVAIESRALFNPNLNYLYFLLSALLPALLQIFVLLGTVHTVGLELKRGTAPEWIEASGSSPLKAAAGKLLPYTIHFSALGLLILSFLFRGIEMPARGSLALIAVSTPLFVLSYQALGLLFAVWTANLRMATSLASFYSGAAFAFSGVTFPTIAMPLAARLWGEVLPLTHYLRLLAEQTLRGAAPSASFAEICALAAFPVLATIFSLGRLRKVAEASRFWGRT